MSGMETNEIVAIIDDAIGILESNVLRDSDRHYSNFIFSPDHPGQSPEEKYARLHGKDETAIIEKLRKVSYFLDALN